MDSSETVKIAERARLALAEGPVWCVFADRAVHARLADGYEAGDLVFFPLVEVSKPESTPFWLWCGHIWREEVDAWRRVVENCVYIAEGMRETQQTGEGAYWAGCADRARARIAELEKQCAQKEQK